MLRMETLGSVFKHHGKKIYQNGLEQRALKQMDLFKKIYATRAQNNQTADIEMLGNDQIIKGDMEDCFTRFHILSSDL